MRVPLEPSLRDCSTSHPLRHAPLFIPNILHWNEFHMHNFSCLHASSSALMLSRRLLLGGQKSKHKPLKLIIVCRAQIFCDFRNNVFQIYHNLNNCDILLGQLRAWLVNKKSFICMQSQKFRKRPYIEIQNIFPKLFFW